MRIKHRMKDRELNPETEILIIGTFNPDVSANPAVFFYDRPRNYLWRLLPEAYNKESLKDESLCSKKEFIRNKKIDFIDLIAEIEIEKGQEAIYKDNYIDCKVVKWANVVEEIKNLKNLKKIGFTRKTFNCIPNIRNKVIEIEEYCKNNHIYFQTLITPARYYNESKQKEWTDFLLR